MAALGQRFDATQHDTTQRDFGEDVPNGIYKLEIEAGEVAKTSDGRGTILKTTVRVIEPAELAGRKIFNNNYNLVNPSAVAEKIGNEQFASLCRAIGVEAVDDSDELLFQAFYARIGLGKPSKGKDGKDYPARAEIKKYFFPTDDQGNAVDFPAPEIDENQPAKAPAAANDNNRQAANDNRQAAQGQGNGKPVSARPWGNKR